MKFATYDTDTGYLIQGYERGRVFVGGKTYETGIIVTPQRIITGWGPATPDDLAAEHIAAMVDLEPQVMILGTGPRQVFPDTGICGVALQRGLAVEVMDTGAACRTYNILMSEGREVVAGLIIC